MLKSTGNGKNQRIVTKREALILISTPFLLRPFGAFAQSQDDFTLMTPLFDLALRVRNDAVGVPLEEFEFAVIRLLEFDFESRRTTLSVARKSGAFTSEESAFRYVESIPQILPDGYPAEDDVLHIASILQVVADIAEEGLPLVPHPDDVVPLRIATIPPSPEATPDTDLIVSVDIILDTLGISIGAESLTKAIIESDDRIESALKSLLAAISTKDWQTVAGLAEVCFKLFVGSEIWDVIKKRGGKKITLRLGLRAVPVVGWIYFGIAFVVSAKKNYNRFSFA